MKTLTVVSCGPNLANMPMNFANLEGSVRILKIRNVNLCENVEFGAEHKCVHLIDITKGNLIYFTTERPRARGRPPTGLNGKG